MVLVKVQLKAQKPGEISQHYRFASLLKADGGLKEIDAAVDAAQHLALTTEELTEAISQAE
jgi:hypothetical protein